MGYDVLETITIPECHYMPAFLGCKLYCFGANCDHDPPFWTRLKLNPNKWQENSTKWSKKRHIKSLDPYLCFPSSNCISKLLNDKHAKKSSSLLQRRFLPNRIVRKYTLQTLVRRVSNLLWDGIKSCNVFRLFSSFRLHIPDGT